MARRLNRRLGFGALAAVLLLAAALVGVNVYLNSEYLPRLIKAEQDWLTVEYSVAWTVWPGRIHFEDLRVRGDERALIWELSANRAKIVADLGGLTERHLTIDQLKLSGVFARVRPRLHYLDAAPEYLRVLPHVSSAGPEFLLEGPPPQEETRRARAPWKVNIRHTDIDGLKELWVDRYQFVGDADAEGAVRVEEGRVLFAGPVTVKVSSGTVSVDGKAVVRDLQGEGSSTAGPIDLSTAQGLALLASVTGEAALKATVVGLDFLPTVRALPVPLELERAQGAVRTRVSLVNGVVQPGAELVWEAQDVVANVVGYSARGALTLSAAVIDVGEGELRTRCTAKMTGFSLGRMGKPPFATGSAAMLALDAPNVELARASVFDEALRDALRNWPAQLAIEDARVVGQERALEWEARIGRLSSHLDLSALERRLVAFGKPRASEVRVKLRPRLLEQEATPDAVRHFAPIVGFAPVPLRTSEPALPLARRAQENPWSIRADDALVEGLRELWVDAYRFEGDATARGGFIYEAGGRLSAGPITTQVKKGTLKIAKWSVASGLTGEVEAVIHPFDLQEPEGYAYFRALTARGDLRGQIDDVGFVRHYPALPFPVVLGGGDGPVRAKLALREGVVQGGTEVHYETRAVQVSTHGYRFVGPFALEAKWAEGPEPRLRLLGTVSPYKVTKVGSDHALVGGALASLRMDVARFDLARPTFEPFSTAEVTDGKVYDLRALNEFIPKDLPLKLEAGAGKFSGRVAFSHKGQATAQVKVGGDKAELVYDKVRMRGDWSVEAKLADVNLTTGEGAIEQGVLLINDMTMREGAHARDGWFGRFELKKGRVRPTGPVLLEGDLDTTMRDGRPLVAFFIAETNMLPVWARTLITLQALRATGRFRLGDGLLELDAMNARGQSLEMRGRMRKKGEHQWGDMLVLSRGQEVGLALRGKRVEFKLIGAAQWYREQMLNPRW